MNAPTLCKVDVLDLESRRKVEEIDITPYLYPSLSDDGEVYFALKVLQMQAWRKCGYTKGRSEISGSNRKMYRQKGTGRARHSTSKAPQFVGGGIAHGPKGLQRGAKVNKKVLRRAMQILLQAALREKQLLVFNKVELKERKTKGALALFPEIQKQKKVIFVDQENKNLWFSVRNIPSVQYREVGFLNVGDLAYGGTLVFSALAFQVLMRRIQKEVPRGER